MQDLFQFPLFLAQVEQILALDGLEAVSVVGLHHAMQTYFTRQTQQGCQIILCTMDQKGGNVPNAQKITKWT